MKLSRRFVVTAAVVVVIAGILAASLPWILSLERRGVALHDLAKLYPPENRALGEVVLETYREYRGNAARWSGVYFTSVFGAAFLSVLAALVLKLEMLQAWSRLRNDLAAISAALAALLITLSTTGDFQRKWQANRIAASAMENLAYELIKPKSAAGLEAVVAAIQEINEARNKGIVGEQAVGTARSQSAPKQSDAAGER